jgi:hypothetical protein
VSLTLEGCDAGPWRAVVEITAEKVAVEHEKKGLLVSITPISGSSSAANACSAAQHTVHALQGQSSGTAAGSQPATPVAISAAARALAEKPGESEHDGDGAK